MAYPRLRNQYPSTTAEQTSSARGLWRISQSDILALRWVHWVGECAVGIPRTYWRAGTMLAGPVGAALLAATPARAESPWDLIFSSIQLPVFAVALETEQTSLSAYAPARQVPQSV